MGGDTAHSRNGSSRKKLSLIGSSGQQHTLTPLEQLDEQIGELDSAGRGRTALAAEKLEPPLLRIQDNG